MRCAWASIDENGHTHGGRAGNQAAELRTGAYYDFGQSVIIRANDPDIAHKIADAVYQIAINKKVGYDQYQRETLFVALQRVGWDPAKLQELCECDCSELGVVGINCAYNKALISADTYSLNIVSRAVKTGKFEQIKITKSTTIKQGDIIVAPGKHVIIAIGSLETPAGACMYQRGKTYTLRGNMNVRAGAGKNKRLKKVSEVTADARKHVVNPDPRAAAVLKKGTRVTCKDVIVLKNGDIWLRIPSGYICGYNGSMKYVN